MDRFNLNLFFALDAILHSATLTEAGRRMHLSQPAMSISLRKLRAYFRDDLVVYDGAGTRLTALAAELRPRIRAVLEASREALELTLEFDPARDAATLRLAAAEPIEAVFLGPLLAGIARSAPAVQVLSVADAGEHADALFRRGVDVAVVAATRASPDCPCEPLFEDTLSCMVWSGAHFGEHMSEAEYFTARHAAVLPAGDAAPGGIGALRTVAVGTAGHAALPQAIAGTDLVATVFTRFGRLCAARQDVRLLPFPVAVPPLRFMAQWQGYRGNEPVIRWAVERLKAAAAAMEPG
ncbi:MAG: LysR substrate-binding domain-containing protein [Sphingomonas sp.]